MESITFNDLARTAVVIVAIWGVCKVAGEIIKAITAKHDKEQRWDAMPGNISKEYDKQLSELRKQNEDMRTDFEAKLQEIRAEQYIMVETLRAILDGLHQQGCNGPVTEAMNNLDDYLVKKAHER
jgi:hypothetical protein